MALLDVEDLAMHYQLVGGWVKAVDGISFSLDKGKTIGLVGESACGKTSIMLTLMRLLPANAKIMKGRILFDGLDLARISEDTMRSIRWRKISMIFQSAMNALNPVFKVGDQIAEPLIVHEHMSKEEAQKKVSDLLELVNLSNSNLNNYPHELSGGMRQRVMIAMSLACDPDLVIADEPTTALDVVVQDQILAEIKDMQKRKNFAMIVVSHDISVVAETCDKIAVMYGGRFLEFSNSEQLFRDPRHPYTIGLLRSFPSLKGRKAKLTSISGTPPDLLRPPEGCLFEPRCPLAKPICKTHPTVAIIDSEHFSECHFASDLEPQKVRFEE